MNENDDLLLKRALEGLRRDAGRAAAPVHPGGLRRAVAGRGTGPSGVRPHAPGALIQLGLPVNPARLSETIDAEVLLGEDNFVRAIRFIP